MYCWSDIDDYCYIIVYVYPIVSYHIIFQFYILCRMVVESLFIIVTIILTHPKVMIPYQIAIVHSSKQRSTPLLEHYHFPA